MQHWRRNFEDRDVGIEALLVSHFDCHPRIAGRSFTSAKEDPHCSKEIQIILLNCCIITT